METGLLWFFLFLALVIGWMLGFVSRPKAKTEENAYQSSQDIKHRLQLFFDSYNDQSIDQFVQSLEVTPETVGLHISIGKYFRTQGEVEKAILIHQNLMAHPELDKSVSDPIVYELAKDYTVAGLFDRAESLLEQLTKSRNFSFKSYSLLLDIYEREKEWQNALDTALCLDLKKNPDIALRASYYCCELADEKLVTNEQLEARRYLKRALSIDKRCARAHIEMAKLEIASEQFRSAINHLKQVAEHTPENIGLALPLLLKSTTLTNTFEQHRAYLSKLYASTGQVAVMLAIVESLQYEGRQEQAATFLARELQKEPNVTALHAFLEQAGGEIKELSAELSSIIKQVTEDACAEKKLYQCSHCGFTGKQMHWMCPSCKSWQSIHPALEYIKQD